MLGCYKSHFHFLKHGYQKFLSTYMTQICGLFFEFDRTGIKYTLPLSEPSQLIYYSRLASVTNSDSRTSPTNKNPSLSHQLFSVLSFTGTCTQRLSYITPYYNYWSSAISPPKLLAKRNPILPLFRSYHHVQHLKDIQTNVNYLVLALTVTRISNIPRKTKQ